MLKRTNLKAFIGGMALWFLWLLAILWAEISIIIFIIGMGFVCQCDTISGFAYSFGAGTTIYLIAAGIFCGLLTGLGQWLILRKRIEHASGWFWATAAGSVIGWELIMIIQPPSEFIDGIGFLIYPLAVSGVISSLAQWWVIRRLKGSYVWILASAVGWGCVILANVLANSPGSLGYTITAAIIGIVIINSTAVWLFQRLRQPALSTVAG